MESQEKFDVIKGIASKYGLYEPLITIQHDECLHMATTEKEVLWKIYVSTPTHCYATEKGYPSFPEAFLNWITVLQREVSDETRNAAL